MTVLLSLLPLLLVLAVPATILATLISLGDHSDEEFEAVGASKRSWTVATYLLGPFAGLAYLTTTRRRLKRLRAQS